MTESEKIDQMIAKLDRAVEALEDINRRTGLLIHQNTGRWDMRVEHDRRTCDVLSGNQSIANATLSFIKDGQ